MYKMVIMRYVGVLMAAATCSPQRSQAACLRSADAFGIMHVHAIERVEEFQPAKEISLGTHRWLRIHKYQYSPQAVEALRSMNSIVMVSDLSPGALSIHDAMNAAEQLQPSEVEPNQWRPIALVMGNEVHLRSLRDTETPVRRC